MPGSGVLAVLLALSTVSDTSGFSSSGSGAKAARKPHWQERLPVAFVFWYSPDSADPKSAVPFWHDPGFRGALKLLNVDHKIDVVWYNLFDDDDKARLETAVRNNFYAFIFGKGCWHTPADKMMRGSLIKLKAPQVKTGLFPACSSSPPPDEVTGMSISLAYDVIFYDKQWLAPTYEHHPLAVHAFGVDAATTFNPAKSLNSTREAWHTHPKLFDWVSVGMFAPWKRHDAIIQKEGRRLVVGYSWRGEESSQIVSTLFSAGVAVWPRVEPVQMCAVYHASERILMAATDLGGGERVLLEARACGVPVEAIELADDNPRLTEFLTCPIFDTAFYASRFAFGIRTAVQSHPEVASGDELDAHRGAGTGDFADWQRDSFRIKV